MAGLFVTVAKAVSETLGLSFSPGSGVPQGGSPSVVVVGSCNTDLVAYVPRFPGAGETIDGHKFEQGFGGKGANQAVMSAKLGAATAMVACVGDDSLGQEHLNNFTSLGMNTDHVSIAKDTATGVAPIFVHSETGENLIVVVAGANNKLTPADVNKAKDMITNAKVVMCQNEIRMESTITALKIASKSPTISVYNPAPAPEDGVLPAEAYSLPDVFCCNETEAELMTGTKQPHGHEHEAAAINAWAESACDNLIASGCKTVVLTLGSRGACIKGKMSPAIAFVSVDKVKAIDTSGAGDSFLGSLGYYLAHTNLDVKEAVRRACALAAISVTSKGTQKSYPSRAEVGQSHAWLLQ